MVDTSSWDRFPLAQLVSKVEEARNKGKYAFILDYQGNVPTFFQYKGRLIEFNKEKLKTQTGSQTKDEALDAIRKAFIFAMKQGDLLCVHLDVLNVDFKAEFKDDAIFNADKFFEFASFRDNDKQIYLPYVKDEENSGIGGLNPGHYRVNESFGACICSTIKDADEIAALLASIPHIDNFEKFIIE
jgi:hypothetical protein